MFEIYLLIIIIGLIIGSFLNVIILRFDDLMSIFVGRSKCPHCEEKLVWYELVPVLSYLALRGKCRSCKKKISVQYPIVEAGTALIFSLLFWKFGLSLEFVVLSLVSCILMVIFIYDILEQQISDWLVISASILWLIYLLINHFFLLAPISQLLSSFYGLLVLGGFLGFMVLISRERWMGAGDIGLGALLGFIIGWPTVLLSGFLAFLIGAVIGIILILTKSLKFQSKLPFAPFLILGFWIAAIWGQPIINWYTNLMFKGF